MGSANRPDERIAGAVPDQGVPGDESVASGRATAQEPSPANRPDRCPTCGSPAKALRGRKWLDGHWHMPGTAKGGWVQECWHNWHLDPMSANRPDEGDAQTDAEIVNKVLEHHANHSTNCGTEADPDDGFGYCTPGCRVYAAREAFNRILARALPEEQPDPTP